MIRPFHWLLAALLLQPAYAGEQSPAVRKQAPSIRDLLPFSPRTRLLWIKENESVVRWTTTRIVDNGVVEEPHTLALDHRILLIACRITAARQPVLLVGTVDKEGRARLYRLHDTDGDGYPNRESAKLLVDSGSAKMFWTDIAFPWPTGPISYVLDRRCQDIWRLRDTDADGLPDALDKIPFARSADIPDLVHASYLQSATATSVTFAYGPQKTECIPGRYIRHKTWTETGPRARLIDMEGSGRASRMEQLPRSSGLHFRYPPLPGKNSRVEIWVAHRTDFEVWAGKTRIGHSAAAAANSWNLIEVSRPLVRGEILRVRYPRSTWGMNECEVSNKPWALIETVGSNFVPVEGGTLELRGLGLSAQMQPRLEVGNGAVIAVERVDLGPKRMGVLLPKLPDSAVGAAKISIHIQVDGKTVAVGSCPVIIVATK